jgi:hypothetical protein
MKKNKFMILGLSVLIAIISSCAKEVPITGPGKPYGHGKGPVTNIPDPLTENIFLVRIKPVITIGSIVYDNIPASLQVISWDSLEVEHKATVSLLAGINSIKLKRAHTRYKLVLTKWDLSDEISFTKEQVNEDSLFVLGGFRKARKLKMTEDFLLVEGKYQPDGKAVYTYKADGSIKQVDFFNKKPQYSDLQFAVRDIYFYNESKLNQIKHYNEDLKQIGYMEFTYGQNAEISHITQKKYDQTTNAYVQYGNASGRKIIDFDYLFSNGNSMTYSMTFIGGNKMRDEAISSTGGGESGTYVYDFNINPYAHIGLPNIYLSNLSKNNLTSQQKVFSGNIPTGVPSTFEYKYDQEGYPVELIRTFKSYTSGANLHTIKTIFTY